MKLQTIVSIATLTLLAACVHPNLSQQNDWKPAENVNDFTADGRRSEERRVGKECRTRGSAGD